jgi:MoxR-like ATPase
MVARELAALRGCDVLDPSVTLDAALLALSGRIRVRDGCGRSAEDVVTELWRRHFETSAPDGDGSEPDAAGNGAPPGKA